MPSIRSEGKRGGGGKREYVFPYGPPLHLYVSVRFTHVAQIRLTSGKQFACTIEGEGEELDPQITHWMGAYADRQKTPPLPLDLSFLSPFSRKGLEAIMAIDRGKVATYGAIAAHIGCPGGARAIGNLCHKNPYPLVIPCHRVVKAQGLLGGFAYPLEIKKTLLKYESCIG